MRPIEPINRLIQTHYKLQCYNNLKNTTITSILCHWRDKSEKVCISYRGKARGAERGQLPLTTPKKAHEYYYIEILKCFAPSDLKKTKKQFLLKQENNFDTKENGKFPWHRGIHDTLFHF